MIIERCSSRFLVFEKEPEKPETLLLQAEMEGQL